MSNREQLRSNFALDRINSRNKIDKELANFIVSTPTLIMTNGLGQTFAYLKSKGKRDANEKHNIVAEAIRLWCENCKPGIGSNDNQFIKGLNGLNQTDYLTLQEEVLKMLQWLKRYARAFQEGG